MVNGVEGEWRMDVPASGSPRRWPGWKVRARPARIRPGNAPLTLLWLWRMALALALSLSFSLSSLSSQLLNLSQPLA